jgi:hypothetical protein
MNAFISMCSCDIAAVSVFTVRQMMPRYWLTAIWWNQFRKELIETLRLAFEVLLNALNQPF